MLRWTGLAPWAFEFPFPGSLTSTFQVQLQREQAVRHNDQLVLQRLEKCQVNPTP